MNAERARLALLAWWEEAGVEADLAAVAGLTPALPRTAEEPVKAPPARAPATKPKAENVPLEAARAAAAAAQDLQAWATAVAAFDGCPLKKAAKATVVADGVWDAPILVIGEAPGEEEDRQGKPFVGKAGRLLDQMLGAIGVSRQTNCLISNCVYWRPPGNRNPTPEELAVCRPFVDRLIALTRPRLLILIGGVAGQALTGRAEGVTRLRGRRLGVETPGLTTPVHAMVMLHPAYLLRQPAQKRLAWADLLTAEAWLEELNVQRAARL